MGQQGSITRIWAPKGTRSSAIRLQQFEYAYILGATCPAQDKALGLVLPLANTNGMIAHLRQISQATPKGRYAVVVMDRASWHTTGKIKCFDNVISIPLPPYSSKLNPVEQLWLHLKQRYLSNIAFKNYDDIVDKICEVWCNILNETNFVSKLCARKWI
ncbi:MAG: IS630 family transposase, partial [Psychromonas sp.]|nr:IS630 family transposase [Psychromonas sp.]